MSVGQGRCRRRQASEGYREKGIMVEGESHRDDDGHPPFCRPSGGLWKRRKAIAAPLCVEVSFGQG